jgi:hypothetical protein
MATSPNYGWLEPDNTDLVKNGALAIRTLGNAIDTTMATMTPKSTVTTKGDLVAATAASTPARLAVGNNGETLVADSSATTGLRYVATPSASNPVLNSAMQVWQRGTSFTSTSGSSYFSADRWQIYSASSGRTYSRQTTSDTTNLPSIQYCTRVARDSGNTNTSTLVFFQNFETINSIPFAGKTVTLSFYARKGANYSGTSDALTVILRTGTGTDQNAFISPGYTGEASPISGTATLTTTWQRFSFSATLGATITELATGFSFVPVGTAGAADYYEITGVQIDIGSVALPYRAYAATFQGELAACQRYYEAISYASGTMIATAQAQSTSAAYAPLSWKVTKRGTPTIQVTSGALAFLVANGGSALATSSFNTISVDSARIDGTSATGLVAGYASSVQASGATTIAISSEL